jgi:hypothetical protein
MVRVNKRLSRNLDYCDLEVERRYIDYLVETDRALVIDNLVIDVPAVVDRHFVCDTDLCIGAKTRSDLHGRSCCSTFVVRAAPSEIKTIDGLLPDVVKRYPTVAAEIDKAGGSWWHYDEEDYNKVLEVASNGGCIFLTPRQDGAYRCALHAVALEKGLDPKRCKPATCSLYPLFMIEVDDDVLLTSTWRETRHVIDEDGDYHHFGCHEANKRATRPLYVEMRSVLEALFGKKTYKRIKEFARKRERESR